jgi:hypothetical protein
LSGGHVSAANLFMRIVSRNMEREHFRQRPAASSVDNLRHPIAEWTGVSGGWKDGDASRKGSSPVHTVATDA